MRIAYFDPFSGASGDMTLGALVDAGVDLDGIRAGLRGLDLDGYHLRAEPTSQHGIHGTRVTVELASDQPARGWRTIQSLIEASSLPPTVRTSALSVFHRLAEAEAHVHGSDVKDVHFHEVGGVDAIVDICGACIGLTLLGIEAVFSGPPRVGSGFARSAHGVIPVPAPATMELLRRAGAAVAPPSPLATGVLGELLTPTGAALLTALAEFRQPSFVPVAIGYGFGQRDLPWPNALRLIVGETSEARASGEAVLETNIDDLNPQFYELLMERLFNRGALDVWLTPITMKKGRPATKVSVLCSNDRRSDLETILFQNSSTLGVRAVEVERTKAARLTATATTRWGDVRLKLRIWNGRVVDAAPEYDDCVAIARRDEIPLRDVWNEAHRIGESYAGRKPASIMKTLEV